MVAVDRDSDGERMPENCYYVGSGSIFAYGVLDAGYRYDLTDEEAYNLGSRATVCEVISVQTCKKPREVEKMKKDKFKNLRQGQRLKQHAWKKTTTSILKPTTQFA